MSFSFAALVWRSGSVWPAAVAHGANNIIGATSLVGTNDWWTTTVLGVCSTVLVAAIVTNCGRGGDQAAAGR